MASALRRPRMAFLGAEQTLTNGCPEEIVLRREPEKLSVIETFPERRVARAPHRSPTTRRCVRGSAYWLCPASAHHRCPPSRRSSSAEPSTKVRCDQGENLGLLPLCLAEILLPSEPQERGDRGVPNAIESTNFQPRAAAAMRMVASACPTSCWQYRKARSPYFQASRQWTDDRPTTNDSSGKGAKSAFHNFASRPLAVRERAPSGRSGTRRLCRPTP